MGMYSTTIKAPEPRDLGEEAADIAAANIRYAPGQYNLESTYRPQYAALDRSIAWDDLFAEDGVLQAGLQAGDALAQQNRQANTAQRTADIEDVKALGGTVQDLQKVANPELYSLMDKVDAKAGAASAPGTAEAGLMKSLGLGSGQPEGLAAAFRPAGAGADWSPAGPADTRNRVATPTVGAVTAPADVARIGQSDVLAGLSSQALAGLQQGGAVDPTMLREIEQATVARYNRMGRADSNRTQAAIAAELDKASEARLQQRYERAMGTEELLQGLARANAGIDQGNQGKDLSVEGLKQQGDVAGGQLAISAANTNRAADDSYRQGLLSLAGVESSREGNAFNQLQTAVNNRGSTVFDPFAGVLSRPSINQTNFAQSSAVGDTNQNPTGALNTFNGYGSNLFSQNFSQANENARQQAQMGSDALGGLISGVGSIAGSLFP